MGGGCIRSAAAGCYEFFFAADGGVRVFVCFAAAHKSVHFLSARPQRRAFRCFKCHSSDRRRLQTRSPARNLSTQRRAHFASPHTKTHARSAHSSHTHTQHTWRTRIVEHTKRHALANAAPSQQRRAPAAAAGTICWRNTTTGQQALAGVPRGRRPRQVCQQNVPGRGGAALPHR